MDNNSRGVSQVINEILLYLFCRTSYFKWRFVDYFLYLISYCDNFHLVVLAIKGKYHVSIFLLMNTNLVFSNINQVFLIWFDLSVTTPWTKPDKILYLSFRHTYLALMNFCNQLLNKSTYQTCSKFCNSSNYRNYSNIWKYIFRFLQNNLKFWKV